MAVPPDSSSSVSVSVSDDIGNIVNQQSNFNQQQQANNQNNNQIQNLNYTIGGSSGSSSSMMMQQSNHNHNGLGPLPTIMSSQMSIQQQDPAYQARAVDSKSSGTSGGPGGVHGQTCTTSEVPSVTQSNNSSEKGGPGQIPMGYNSSHNHSDINVNENSLQTQQQQNHSHSVTEDSLGPLPIGHIPQFTSSPEINHVKRSLRAHHTVDHLNAGMGVPGGPGIPGSYSGGLQTLQMKGDHRSNFSYTSGSVLQAERLYSMYTRKRAQQLPYTVIVYHKSMEALARRIKEEYPMKIKLVHLNYSNFQDGWPNLAFTPHDVHKMQDPLASTCYLGSFHDPKLIFEQFAVIYALPKMLVRNFRVVVPWFSTGTMERVETLGQIATAKTLAKMLDCTPSSKTGPTTITIYDIHALSEQFYFSDNVIVEMKSAVFLLKQELVKQFQLTQQSQSQQSSDGHTSESQPQQQLHHNFAIGFPDDGAKKRFGIKFPEYPQVVMAKERVGELRKVVLKDGDPRGKHVVVVDDLVQTGGTLIESMKALREAGAEKISCFVTHGVFPNESWRRFVDLDCLDTFYICDTIPVTADVLASYGRPFKVLSIASLLGYLLVGRESGAKMLDHETLDTC